MRTVSKHSRLRARVRRARDHGVRRSRATPAPTWIGSFNCNCLSAATYPFQSFVAKHVFTTPDPGGTGQAVAAFDINNTDQPYDGSYPRADMFSPAYFRPGADYYMSIPVRIPTGLPLTQDDATSFFQWAQIDYPGNSEPALGLNIGSHGDTVNHYDLDMSDFDGTSFHWDFPWVGAAVDGHWHTAILHVHFESDSTGFVQLWWDGVRQTFSNGSQTWNGPTLTVSPDGEYRESLDIDSYRAPNFMPGTVAIDHGAPAIGTSYASVAGTVRDGTVGP